MLPSGNDAAQSLAIYFGNQILQNKGRRDEELIKLDGNIKEEDYPEDLPV